MKIQTRIYSRKLPESIQNAISFDIIQVKNFKTFMERPSLVVILCLRQWHIFQKWGAFQRSKGCGHEKFSRGQAPGPPPCLASLAPRLSPPNINFVPTGLTQQRFFHFVATQPRRFMMTSLLNIDEITVMRSEDSFPTNMNMTAELA